MSFHRDTSPPAGVLFRQRSLQHFPEQCFSQLLKDGDKNKEDGE